jgi:hypothetical protein
MTAVHNEKTKLTANFLNGVGIAVFAVGGFSPLIASVYGSTAPTFLLVPASVICILFALAIHLLARQVLKRMLP